MTMENYFVPIFSFFKRNYIISFSQFMQAVFHYMGLYTHTNMCVLIVQNVSYQCYLK
jgi:hypothetical protein